MTAYWFRPVLPNLVEFDRNVAFTPDRQADQSAPDGDAGGSRHHAL
jgi:hypothetical protein